MQHICDSTRRRKIFNVFYWHLVTQNPHCLTFTQEKNSGYGCESDREDGKLKGEQTVKKPTLFEKVPTGLVQRATPYLNGIILPCLTSSQHKLGWLPPSHDCDYIVSMMTFASVVCWLTFYNLLVRPCGPLGLVCRDQSVCELLSRSKSCYVWTSVPFPCKRQVPKIYKKQIHSLKNNSERVIWKKKVI